MYLFSTLKQTWFPYAFSNQASRNSSCPFLSFFLHFTLCLGFQPVPLLALYFCISPILLFFRNVLSPLPEQRNTNSVPEVIAYHLLGPSESKVFHSKRFRNQLHPDTYTTERFVFTLNWDAEIQTEGPQVILLEIYIGGFDVIPCTLVFQFWLCLG